jgi:hypothetical protein
MARTWNDRILRLAMALETSRRCLPSRRKESIVTKRVPLGELELGVEDAAPPVNARPLGGLTFLSHFFPN